MNNRDQDITPTQAQLQKRQEALRQLQGNRGGMRQVGNDTVSEELKQARSVLKQYAQQEKLRRSQGLAAAPLLEAPENVETASVEAVSAEQPPETSLAAAEPSANHALQQLRQQVQAKRALKKQIEALGDVDLAAEFSPATQHRLISQLLSEDFLENTKLWLSSTSDPAKEQPSTSVAELESCHKQIKYRMKVLKVLLEDTQKELDHMELQLRAARP
ncbi:MAG: hypothetical protein AB8B99_11260 [Phormidesmis sp.]